ncbi:ATP-binding protein [Streptomyces sp. NPDC059168]|uniref:ATP-binding protein n=1 Tax=Streptomyces sp. NPDC059168 TaxID=3346753 RepID=UPI003677AC40
MADCEDRDRRRSERRIRAAGFPRQKWLSDFDYTANASVAPALINNLATCEWVKKGEPLGSAAAATSTGVRSMSRRTSGVTPSAPGDQQRGPAGDRPPPA